MPKDNAEKGMQRDYRKCYISHKGQCRGGVSLGMQEHLVHLVVKSSEASIVSMRYSVNMCLLTDGCGKSGTSSLKSTM